VFDAAEEIANRQGFDGLTLQAVAGALGVRPPSLYNHVAGLPAIRRALHLRGLQAQAATYASALEATAENERPRSICIAQRAFASTCPGIYAAAQPSVHLPGGDEELLRVGEQLLDVWLDAVAALGLHGDDALHAVRGVRSAVHGFISLEAAGAFGMSIDVDESSERLVTTLERGLR
jgi:AcrR family transcriptional regulator